MRCPLGLVFDDIYQRCEWPGFGGQSAKHRLSSLRNKKNEKKQMRSMTTIKQKISTVTPATKLLEP